MNLRLYSCFLQPTTNNNKKELFRHFNTGEFFIIFSIYFLFFYIKIPTFWLKNGKIMHGLWKGTEKKIILYKVVNVNLYWEPRQINVPQCLVQQMFLTWKKLLYFLWFRCWLHRLPFNVSIVLFDLEAKTYYYASIFHGW